MWVFGGRSHTTNPSFAKLKGVALESALGFCLRVKTNNRQWVRCVCANHAQDVENTSPNEELIGLHEFLDEPVKVATLASLLRRCSRSKALTSGRRVHAHITKHRYDHNTFLGNFLIEMYGNCGGLNDAQEVFDSILKPNLYSWNILIKAYGQNGWLDNAKYAFSRMPSRDVVSWTAMMAAYCQNGHGKEALDLFHQMQLEGIMPNNITFVCTIDACKSLAALYKGQEIHIAISELGYEREVVVGTALINMYSKCGDLHHARRVFGRMPQRDVVACNAMIAGLAHNGHPLEALAFFRQMQLEGLKPDKISLICALDACGRLAALEEGQDIHAAIIEFGHEQDVVVANTLISMYGRCWSLLEAKTVFDRISHRTIVSWNAMITTFAENGFGKEALFYFRQMQIEGVMSDEITVLSVLCACASLAALEVGQEVHAALVIDMRNAEDVPMGNSLISMYGKSGNLSKARDVFDKMRDRDAVSWNAMIAAYSHSNHGIEALDLYDQMQLEGRKPDKVTFVCTLDACGSQVAHEAGQEAHVSIVDRGFDQDVVVGNALVGMYGKCGSLPDARSVFERMACRDVVSWTTMITAFARNGRGKGALDFLSKMQLEGTNPDEVTIICALSACIRNGQLDDGKHLFMSMNRGHGISYTMDHYVCMVDLLARSGHLDEAENLIKNLPAEKVAAAWSCLLGACRIHGDVERGVRAASHCFELDAKNGGSYVMLSNIYAAASTRQL